MQKPSSHTDESGLIPYFFGRIGASDARKAEDVQSKTKLIS
jgi:hypothetical protein